MEEIIARVHLPVLGGVDRGNDARVAGDAQRIVDIEHALAESAAVGVQHRGGGVRRRAVVGNENGCLAALKLVYRAGVCLFVHGHADLVARGERAGVDIHSHVAVQREHRESAVLHHARGDVVILLRIDDLHAAVHTGRYVRLHRFSGRAAKLLVELIELGLHIAHRAHNGGELHRGERVALLHALACLDENFLELHALGQDDRLRVRVGEHAGAGDRRADAAGRDGRLAHGRRVHAADGFADLSLRRAHGKEYGERQHRDDRDRHNDAAAFFALLFTPDRGKQRLVPVLGLLRGGRYILFIHTLVLL